MATVTYKVLPLSVTDKQAFQDASAEELRVLLALVERSGDAEPEELAQLAGTSVSRARSALVFWESEGVILRRDGNIVNEFPEREDLSERRSVTVAKSIRDKNLELLLTEIATILGKPTLTTVEIKNIEEIYTSLGISSEYIVTLAAHIASEQEKRGKKLTSTMLRTKAHQLVEKEYDTVEELEKYIYLSTRDSDIERMMREILGWYGKSFSDTQKRYFNKWCVDFGYGDAIISLAYDYTAINTQGAPLAYMDKILTAWHDAGCKTVEQCKAQYSADGEKRKSSRTSKREKTTSPTPKYGSFDANEAFLAALERSYGEDN